VKPQHFFVKNKVLIFLHSHTQNHIIIMSQTSFLFCQKDWLLDCMKGMC